MIAVICAMKEERDALLKMMKDVKTVKGKKLLYHDEALDNEYYLGTLANKEIVVSRCGVGQLYAALSTASLIEKYKPELIINLGCAGSLKENVHIGDVVIADKTAAWRFDVPGWKRSFDSLYTSFGCSDEVVSIAKKISDPTMHIGGIVSADEFIRTKTQLKVIKRHYPDALCGEMEGAAVAGVCYAYHTPVSIIRSISDETLVQGNYKHFEFHLEAVCEKAARLCKEIIKRYK